jgi:hypothetical protein
VIDLPQIINHGFSGIHLQGEGDVRAPPPCPILPARTGMACIFNLL